MFTTFDLIALQRQATPSGSGSLSINKQQGMGGKKLGKRLKRLSWAAQEAIWMIVLGQKLDPEGLGASKIDEPTMGSPIRKVGITGWAVTREEKRMLRQKKRASEVVVLLEEAILKKKKKNKKGFKDDFNPLSSLVSYGKDLKKVVVIGGFFIGFKMWVLYGIKTINDFLLLLLWQWEWKFELQNS